ncbi:MAG: hypothetical protein JXR48_03565 [Candidatus Delongbacteria bacterium]|nr:hypothetical protein [Candidatus Delongbacteria bacterium]
MDCPNRNRERPRTLAFRCTDEEFETIDKRIKVTGEVKGDYLREAVLNAEVHINVGKFKSDKLALEIRNITRELHNALNSTVSEEIAKIIIENQIMFKEMYKLVVKESNMNFE